MIDIGLILSIVGAAIALIIGIIVYSEVSDAVSETTTITQPSIDEVNELIQSIDSGTVSTHTNTVSLFPTTIVLQTGESINDVILKYGFKNSSGTDRFEVAVYRDSDKTLLAESSQVIATGYSNGQSMEFTFINPFVATTTETVRIAINSDGNHQLRGNNGIGTTQLDTSVGYGSFSDPFNEDATESDSAYIEIIRGSTSTIDIQPEALTRADSIAFTILTIMPISMFFGLFAIFGGFKND